MIGDGSDERNDPQGKPGAFHAFSPSDGEDRFGSEPLATGGFMRQND